MELPFQPSPPEAPHFDQGRNAWILGHYVEVHAALREPALYQASAQNEMTGIDHAQLHAQVQADIARMTAAEWRAQMERSASVLMDHASHGQPINLVSEIIQPWSVDLMLSLNGDGPVTAKRLTRIAGRLFYRRGPSSLKTPGHIFSNKWYVWRHRAAAAQLERMLQQRQLLISKSMFSGMTQTLPSFLAKAWLALLQHPEQLKKLMNEPELMPGATEELLRYAGIVHTLYRQASSNVRIGETEISKGQGVILKMASANFDPAKFDRPYELDITRRPAGQMGLGDGLHACVGAALVRTGFAVITPLFLASAPTLEPDTPVVWTNDTTLHWPLAVFARMQRQHINISGQD